MKNGKKIKKNQKHITFLITRIKKRAVLALSILTAAIVFAAVFIFWNTCIFEKDVLIINNSQKKEIVQYAYDVLDNKFSENSIPDYKKELNKKKQYNRIFITLLNDGEKRCCQGGYINDFDKTISEDIELATNKCIKDERYGGVLEKLELKSLDIVIDVLYGEQKIVSKNLDDFKKEIELGIHAIKIAGENSSAYFKASVPVEKRYSLQKTLERLCKKAKLDKNCYTDENVSVYKYNSISFKSDRSEKIVDLYRNSILIDVDEITAEFLKESILSGHQWFKNHINPKTNILNYLYYPNSNKYSGDDNHVRKLAAMWAVSKLSSFLEREDLRASVKDTIDYYLSYSVNKSSFRYINIDQGKLAYNAFAILALIDQKSYPDRDKIMKELAEAILIQQRQDGSFSTIFEKDSNKSIDYYPGEAMLALMSLYLETGENKYADAVESAFPYYRNYWRNNKNTAFIPWQSQAYKLLFDKTKNRELADFIFEMNDWLVDSHQQISSPYFDYVGGFKERPGSSTAAYLEGLADAYTVAKKIGDMIHIEKYEKSCKYATRFVLQTQFKKEDAFYVFDIQKTLGGFKTSPLNISLRIDSTQHAVLALIKIYQNNLFK